MMEVWSFTCNEEYLVNVPLEDGVEKCDISEFYGAIN